MGLNKRYSPSGTEKVSVTLSTVHTAKLIRKALKGAFPGVKFSVTSSLYSGGSSVSIGWMDGPTSRAVDLVVQRFAGCTFDGMTDSKSYVDGSYAGVPISFGPSFVFTNRQNSAEALEKALDTVFLDATIREECERPGVRSGETGGAWCDSNEYVKSYHEPLDRIVNRELFETSIGGPYPGLEGCSDSVEDLLPFLSEREKDFVNSLPDEVEEEESVEAPPSNAGEALQRIGKELEEKGWRFFRTHDEWPRFSLVHGSGARVDAYVLSKDYLRKEWDAEITDDMRLELRAYFPKGYTPPYSEVQAEAWKITVSASRETRQAALDVERRLLSKLLDRFDDVKKAVRAKKIEDAQLRNMSEFLCRISGGKVPAQFADRPYLIRVWLKGPSGVLAGEISFRLASKGARGEISPPTISIGSSNGTMSGIPLREGIEIVKILRTCGEPR